MNRIKKSLLFCTIGISLYFVVKYFIFKDKFIYSNFTKKTQKPLVALIQLQGNKKNLSLKSSKGKLIKIEKFLNQEVILVSGLNSNPKKTLNRLKIRAARLTESDFKYLLPEVLNIKKNGDRRFLSVYLMSLSDNSKAVPYLKKIISASIIKTKANQRLYEQELVIKMKAIEGFLRLTKTKANYQKKVNQLLKQQENPFLVKFIRNSL